MVESGARRINVIVIDDSAVVRQAITATLSRDRSINVMAAVADPLFAMQRMRIQWPDVVVLDVEMPRMDGLTFLAKIMSERPTPVVICSTLTVAGAETTIQALSAGAFAIVTKPKLGMKEFLLDASGSLLEIVRAAARANMANLAPQAARAAPPVPGDIAPPALQPLAETTQRIVAIGTSTGGTQALEVVLSALPRVSPAIVVVQHMPEKFTTAFAARLDKVCQIEVREAEDGDRLLPGRALIAPGGRHMLLKRSGAQYHVEVTDGPLVNRHRPSVDALFLSVAKHAGRNALGVIMTGMGDDGARGILAMHEARARTIAQDEASCVVFGMPKEAIRLGGVQKVANLQAITREITTLAA
jgi:two-component system chemotaxis response regulator CheB